jgi:hypothetical protein
VNEISRILAILVSGIIVRARASCFTQARQSRPRRVRAHRRNPQNRTDPVAPVRGVGDRSDIANPIYAQKSTAERS